MRNIDIDETLFQLMFVDTQDSFYEYLKLYFLNNEVDDYTVWEVRGNICEPAPQFKNHTKGAFDIVELGFEHNVLSRKDHIITYFEYSFHITSSVFFVNDGNIVSAISFHKVAPEKVLNELETYAPFISKRIHEIKAKERRMDLYVDYQKKVDFVKRASIIFKALEVDEVISMALSFFMEVFSANAVFALKDGAFSGIGVDESDTVNLIFYKNKPLSEFVNNQKDTEYFDSDVFSDKFNIQNMFFVNEETTGIKFVLFNILIDIVPDKDFSSLVSSIVSIAAENALNHEKMTKFKLEEMEIAKTVAVLKCFVKEHISITDGYDIFAVNYPARIAGGDFVDVKTIGDDIYFFIADVCGKGYSAAVLTVVLSFFASDCYTTGLSNALKKLNAFLLDKITDDRFITGFFGVLHKKDKTMEYISCGHDPAVILFEGGKKLLLSDYLPLGLEHEEYVPKKVGLPAGALVLAYTDGLTEYASFEDILSFVGSNSQYTSKEIAQSLYSELVKDRSAQRDDFTCIIMKI